MKLVGIFQLPLNKYNFSANTIKVWEAGKTEIGIIKLAKYLDIFKEYGFSVYFLGYCDKEQIPSDEDKRWDFTMNLAGCIELTYNYGTDKIEDRVYNTGNGDKLGLHQDDKVRMGYGHIGITVPDVYEACQRLHQLNVQFAKSPNQGSIKGLAFIKDPDGYLIEILPQGPFAINSIDCLGISL